MKRTLVETNANDFKREDAAIVAIPRSVIHHDLDRLAGTWSKKGCLKFPVQLVIF